jgi:hypothetical protein
MHNVIFATVEAISQTFETSQVPSIKVANTRIREQLITNLGMITDVDISDKLYEELQDQDDGINCFEGVLKCLVSDNSMMRLWTATYLTSSYWFKNAELLTAPYLRSLCLFTKIGNKDSSTDHRKSMVNVCSK